LVAIFETFEPAFSCCEKMIFHTSRATPAQIIVSCVAGWWAAFQHSAVHGKL
jgi:hypothetical protein